jgi:hypothetical protein
MALVFLIFVMFVTGPIVLLDFISFLVRGGSLLAYGILSVIEGFTLLVYPFIYLLVFDLDQKNDCCTDSAFFSPSHRLSIYLLIITCLVAYFYSKWRTRPAPPLIEVMVNCLLVAAIILNVVLMVHGNDGWLLWLIGSGPIIVLFLYRLIDNHRTLLDLFDQYPELYSSQRHSFFLMVLKQDLWRKIPLLFLLCFPLLFILTLGLLLFGQKPDSFIQAFTDTYKHGLSELDCNNVTCPDGHFLCTIAASGHKQLVQPQRTGVRQNRVIKVNRQLLIANAFEDLLAEKLPRMHKPIRECYNVVGGNCKKLYDTLSNKWIADAVYVLMKPAEWLFLVCLYAFDRKPENRIAKQYLYDHDRNIIDNRF